MTTENDPELMNMLSDLGIESLYDVLHRNRITTDVIWDLSKPDLKELNIYLGDRLRFIRAKSTWKEKQKLENGKHITVNKYIVPKLRLT